MYVLTVDKQSICVFHVTGTPATSGSPGLSRRSSCLLLVKLHVNLSFTTNYCRRGRFLGALFMIRSRC